MSLANLLPRQLFAILLTLCCVLPALAAPKGEADARHLLNRTGFGAPPALVAEYARLSRAQAVERLLDGSRSADRTPPPDLVYRRPSALKNLPAAEQEKLKKELVAEGVALRAWWLGEMLHAPTAQDALRERMTLFWHNHFVSGQRKVRSASLMLRQNELLRRYALANTGALLHAVGKDPAMILYLDGASNRKESPNENFAREVMELFTLGEGRYSERDIKEAARAFTGWSFDPEAGEFRWRQAVHDAGEKTVLGRTGEFDGDDVLSILLAQPATAEFLSRKLWRDFVSPDPEPAAIRRIAAAWRGAGYEVSAALRAMLMSEAFWAPENRLSLIKSPVDVVVGSLRTLDVPLEESRALVAPLRNMGQDIFDPPNVRGWPGGESWINATTLLARKQFVERLLQRLEGRRM